LDKKDVKYIFINHGIGMKEYKIWDPMDRKFLYRKNVILKEVELSPTILYLEEHENNLVVHLPPKTEKHELENEQEVHDGPNEEEESKSSEEE
jgi:hypothetical protein